MIAERVGVGKRLPVVGIDGLDEREAERNGGGRIDRSVAGPIGVRAESIGFHASGFDEWDVAELIGLVVVASFEDGGTSYIADAGGRFDVGGVVVRVVAELTHQGFEDGFGIGGEEVG